MPKDLLNGLSDEEHIQARDIKVSRPTPVLQILHVSDMHVADTDSNASKLRRLLHFAVTASTPRVFQWFRENADGLAPHDPMAHIAFKQFLMKFFSIKDEWSQVDSWFLDTGDATAWGDSPSLSKAWIMQNYFLHDLRFKRDIRLAGNHDAWPALHPALVILSPIKDIQRNSQKRRLSDPLRPYPNCGTSLPSHTLPHGGSIHIFHCETVTDDPVDNALALGYVSTHGLDELIERIDSECSGPDAAPSLRILVTHHPVKYPKAPTCKGLTMRVKNDADIVGRLAGATKGGLYPAVHLMLSGHTHARFPPLGSFNVGTGDFFGPPFQLVVGTLMQAPLDEKAEPHQAQILRLSQYETNPSLLRVERLVVEREAGHSGAYRLRSAPADTDRPGRCFHEAIELDISGKGRVK